MLLLRNWTDIKNWQAIREKFVLRRFRSSTLSLYRARGNSTAEICTLGETKH